MMRKFDLPPLWTLLCLLAILLINLFWPVPNLRDVVGAWLGVILMIYAVYVIIWAARTFRKAKTPIHPGRTPKVLVRSGPFAISRNPIYTAMIVFSVGFALIQGSVYGFLPIFGLFYILKHRFVEPEETRLIEEFGEEGQAYVQNTWRW